MHQVLVDLLVHRVGEGLVLRVRVHRLGVALAGEAQGLRMGATQAECGGGRDGGEDESFHGLSNLLSGSTEAGSLGSRPNPAVGGKREDLQSAGPPPTRLSWAPTMPSCWTLIRRPSPRWWSGLRRRWSRWACAPSARARPAAA